MVYNAVRVIYFSVCKLKLEQNADCSFISSLINRTTTTTKTTMEQMLRIVGLIKRTT